MQAQAALRPRSTAGRADAATQPRAQETTDEKPDEKALLLDDFESVMRAHQRRIYRLLAGWVRDAERAEALTQETFLRAWRRREGFRGDASLATWLTRIALHAAQDDGRSRRRQFWRTLFRRPAVDAANDRPHDDPHGDPPCDQPSAERQLLGRERVEALHRAMAGLPRRQREVFHLRHLEEMSLLEIADVLGVAEGTVKVHLSRATHAVRGALDA